MCSILLSFTKTHSIGDKKLKGTSIFPDFLINYWHFNAVNKISFSLLAKMPDYLYTCINYSFLVLFLAFKNCIQHQF